MTRINLQGTIPPGRPPFILNTVAQTTIEIPLALTVARPDHHIHVTRWLVLQGISSDPFNYDQGIGPAGTYVENKMADPLSARSSRLSAVLVRPNRRAVAVPQAGFHHIVPREPITFSSSRPVLPRISWRKLISQTTVFTIATRPPSTCRPEHLHFASGSWSQGIALSIMIIALEISLSRS